MSARMQFPLSQRRHTNIAVVRYAKNGIKLEIACYKNKVISYRSGTENRLDEVLQVERVFTNVARGHLASEKDIQTAFGSEMTEQEAIKYILDHGELQVAQQERTAEVDEIFKDIAIIISQKCVNTSTQHPFPSQVIEQALRSIGAAVKLDQPVKKQALGLIHQLIDSNIIPIARANMKIRCSTTSDSALVKLRSWCLENAVEVVEKDPASEHLGIPNGDTPHLADGSWNGGDGSRTAHYSLLLLLQPHLFRDLDRFVKEELPLGSAVHMLDAAVTDVGDADGLLDANAISHANAQPGRAESSAARSGRTRVTAAASSSSGGGARGGTHCGDAWVGSSKDGDAESATGGPRRRGGKGLAAAAATRRGRRGCESGDEDDDSRNDEVATPRHDEGPTKKVVAGDEDITAQLQKLGLDVSRDLGDDSDGDDVGGRGRGGRGKRLNKKDSCGGTAPSQGSAALIKKAGARASSDDENAPAKGKRGKKNVKKEKTAQPMKAESAVQEALSDSDEELMGNRKQRAKKQQQEVQAHQGGTGWENEDEFDYGDEEEEKAEV